MASESCESAQVEMSLPQSTPDGGRALAVLIGPDRPARGKAILCVVGLASLLAGLGQEALMEFVVRR